MADGFPITDEGRIRLSVQPTSDGRALLSFAVPVHTISLTATEIVWLIKELQRAQPTQSEALTGATN